MPRLQTPSRPTPEPQQTLCSPTALLSVSIQSPYALDRIPVTPCLRVRGLLRWAAGLQARAAGRVTASVNSVALAAWFLALLCS